MSSTANFAMSLNSRRGLTCTLCLAIVLAQCGCKEVVDFQQSQASPLGEVRSSTAAESWGSSISIENVVSVKKPLEDALEENLSTPASENAPQTQPLPNPIEQAATFDNFVILWNAQGGKTWTDFVRETKDLEAEIKNYDANFRHDQAIVDRLRSALEGVALNNGSPWSLAVENATEVTIRYQDRLAKLKAEYEGVRSRFA